MKILYFIIIPGIAVNFAPAVVICEQNCLCFTGNGLVSRPVANFVLAFRVSVAGEIPAVDSAVEGNINRLLSALIGILAVVEDNELSVCGNSVLIVNAAVAVVALEFHH